MTQDRIQLRDTLMLPLGDHSGPARSRRLLVIALGLLLATAQLLVTQHAHASELASGSQCSICLASAGASAPAPAAPVVFTSQPAGYVPFDGAPAEFQLTLLSGACGARAPPAVS